MLQNRSKDRAPHNDDQEAPYVSGMIPDQMWLLKVQKYILLENLEFI